MGNFPARHASGFLRKFNVFGGELWAFCANSEPLQACSATIMAACRQLMHLSDNLFRRLMIKEPSSTFCNGHSGADLAFSVSLGISCQPSGILQTTFHLLGCYGAVLSQTGLGAVQTRAGRDEGGVV